MRKLLNRFWCLFGIHNWAWKLSEVGGILNLSDPIPDCAKCEDCGKLKGDDK